MKKRFASTLILSISCAYVFCQDSTEKKDTYSTIQKDSIAKSLVPVEGKAIVYILRPSKVAFVVKMGLKCDNVRIGGTKADTYVYSVLEPGKHTFLSTSENQATLSVTLEGGKIYYIRQEVKMGVFFAETGLKLEDEQKGQKDLRKCTLARDNVYTN
jgi:hypothetical protein